MKYENEKLGCSFTIPDRPSVRQQLAFWEHAGRGGDDGLYIGTWEGAKTIISDWECEALPDIKQDIDEMTDPKQAQVIIWTANQVIKHMGALDALPKA